ncbi:MAG: sulfotransferase family protein [Acidimicrobiales bacterium]
MIEPNFFVIGAQRAGSTSMWRYLRAHPEIYMAEAKEPGFVCFAGGTPPFNHNGDPNFEGQIVLDEGAYLDLFTPGADRRYRGESSSFYLYIDDAQAELARRFPDAKLLIVLRDPIDRIWSSFNYLRRLGGEPLETLDAALEAEPQRIADHWEPLFHYVAESRYSEQLTRLYEKFDRDQVHVAVLERLQADGPAEMARIFTWLGIDPDADVGVEVRHNSAGRSRVPALSTILTPGFLPDSFADRIPRGLKDRAVAVRERLRSNDYDDMPASTRARLEAALADELTALPPLVDFDPADHWTFFGARR